MPFLTQGQTNWKFIGIVVILAVIVGGGLWSYLQLTEEEFEIPPVGIPEKFEDKTADWQAYKNEEMGFEIKYPETWEIRSEHSATNVSLFEVTFRPISEKEEYGSHIFITGFTFASRENPEDIICKYTTLGESLENPTINQFEKIKIGNENFYYIFNYRFEGQYGVHYYVVGKDEVIGFYLSSIVTKGEWTDPNYKVEEEPNHIILNQMLSTFRFIEDEMEILSWEPICESQIKKPFTVEVKEGEGLTHLARKGITEYINSLNIVNMGKEVYSLNSEEKILAEDYISKNLGTSESLTIGQEVKIPCPLVESTLLAVRELVTEKLTEEQIDNLKTYGRSVISIEMLRAIQEIIDKTTPEDGLQPIIIPIGN